MTPAPELSVVLPVLNEEANLHELHRRLASVLQDLGVSYEIVFVDDGSADGSVEILRRFAEVDPRTKVVILSRRFGHQIALSAGLDAARGDAVVLMDSDLQDPPEVIPELVKLWREGRDVVYAQRKARPGESALKRGTAFLFYRLLRRVATVEIPPDTGDFRLLSRRAAEALRATPERRRFLRGLVAWVGFPHGKVLYDRPARAGGQSKYQLREMVHLAITAGFSFSRFPVTLLGVAGLLVCLGSVLATALGVSAFAGGLFFLGGVQMLGLWILGQYLGAIADEVRRRPLYVIRETLNLQSVTPRPASEMWVPK